MNRTRAISSILGLTSVGGLATPAFAGGGAATDAYEDIAPAGLDAHGLVDAYVIRNFDDPASGVNQLREFDFRDRTSLGYLGATLAARPHPIGFRLDAGIGNTAEVFEEQDPAAPNHPRWARAGSYVGQAFVTVRLPFGRPSARPIELDAGKFATPVGMEDNESLPNWNYSRSLLYSWAEPTLHTGLRATCRATPTVAVSAFWVNGWNAGLVDGSDMRTFAAAVTWKPADAIEVSAVDMAGPEHPPTELAAPLSFRNIADAAVVVHPWDGVAFALTADFGRDRTSGGVTWWGASWYARVQSPGWFAATLRAEFLSDPDGFVTGTRQSLAELTGTAEGRARFGRLRLVSRLEYRHNQSNANVFDAALPASRNHQDTVTLAFMGAF